MVVFIYHLVLFENILLYHMRVQEYYIRIKHMVDFKIYHIIIW